jgi:lysophospholipase L1-like esterase
MTRRVPGAGLSALACALVMAAAPAAARAADSCSGAQWLASWAASPAGNDGTVFTDQTVRMTITPHAGGTDIRVHLSNRRGTDPVTFSSVTVATPAGGATVVPASITSVTFGGQAAVTVPAGQDVTSDPVAFAVEAFHDVSVSLAVIGSGGPATVHFTAQDPSYVTGAGSGDHTADAGDAAFSAFNRSWYYLDGLDVGAPQAAYGVAAMGDSLTDGFGTGLGADTSYPDQLATTLAAAGLPVSVVNAGISGNRLIARGTAPAAISRVDPDVLALAGVTDVIVLLGSNDLLSDPPQEPAAVDSALDALVRRLQAGGLKVALGTLTPLARPIYLTDGSTYEAARDAVDHWIETASPADAVVDFGAALADPSNPGLLRGAYDSGDGQHPDAAGYGAMAAAAGRLTFRANGCTPAGARALPSVAGGSGAAKTPAAKGSAGGRARPALSLSVRALRSRRGRSAPEPPLRATGHLGRAGGRACPRHQRIRLTALSRRGTAIGFRTLALTAKCTFGRTVQWPSRTQRQFAGFRASYAGDPTLAASASRRVTAP